MSKKDWRKTIVAWLKHKDQSLLAKELPCPQKFATTDCHDYKEEVEAYARILADQENSKITSVQRISNIIGIDEQLVGDKVYLSLLISSTHTYCQNDKTNTEQQKNVVSFVLMEENDHWKISSFEAAGGSPVDNRIISLNDSSENLSTPQISQSNYNRQAAVAYANRYWEQPNPNFRHFDDDCTNFISQSLYAGGFPMIQTGDPKTGWWYKSRAKQYGGNTQNDTWSYSWAVAHSFANYLMDSNRVVQKNDPRELELGDIISYSWNGDNVYNHSTIVVGKDYNGYPIVAAHSVDSTNRPWAYRDSTSWKPGTQYLFFHIL